MTVENIDGMRKVLALAQGIADTLNEVLKDETVDWQDLPKLVPILAKLKPAVDGAKQWKPIGELTDEEMQILVGDLTKIVATFVATFNKPRTALPIQQL